jgi:hypothetical protein
VASGKYVRKVAKHCPACLAPRPRTEAPDPCLGWLPGVKFACCGHGSSRMCYVMTEDGTVRGEEAREKLRELGGTPAEFSRDDMATWRRDDPQPE